MRKTVSMQSTTTRLAAALTIGMGILLGCSTPPDTAKQAAPEVRRPAKGQDLDTFWSDHDWKDLTPTEQALWAKLGWNEPSWQEEADAPASETQKWGELTDEGRAVAGKLGYTEKYWDSLASSQGQPEKAGTDTAKP